MTMYSSEGIITSGDFNFDDAAAVLQKAKRGMQCKVRLAPHADHRHAPPTTLSLFGHNKRAGPRSNPVDEWFSIKITLRL